MYSPKFSYLSLLVLFASLFLSACDGVEERKAKYLSQAETSLEAKNYDKAKLGYKNVIQIDPKDVDARLGLARVLVAQQEWRQAAGQYKGALDVDGQNTEAAIGLGKLYMLARASDLALEQAENVLQREPENIDALTLKAGVLAQKNDLISALDILEDVHAEAPDHVDSSVLLATLLTRTLEHEKAIGVAKTTLAHHPDNVDLHAVMIGVYGNLEQHDQAIATIRKLIDIREGEFSQFQRLVAYLHRIGKAEQAQQELESYIGNNPQNLDARKALIDLYVGRQQLDQAESTLKTYIKEFDQEFDFQLGLARIKLLQKDQDAALSVLETVIKNNVGGPFAIQARNQKAKLLLASDQVDAAKTIFDQVLAEEPANFDALMTRGGIALNEGRSLDAINDFRSALKNNPDNADVTRALAGAHSQAGELRLAENYYRQLVTRFPDDLVSRNALAGIQAQTGKVDEALALRQEIAKKAPDSVANLIEMAKLYAAKNDGESLQGTADALIRMGGENLQADAGFNKQSQASGYYFKGLASQLERDHDAAIKHFDLALDLSPKAVEPVSAKVKSLLALKKNADAIKWLEARLDAQEDNPMLLNLLAEVFMLEQDYAQAREKLDQAISKGKSWMVPYRNKALSYKAEGELEQAILTLEQGVKEVENDGQLRLELAQLYEANQNVDAAIEQYEVLNQGDNAPLFAANNLAMLLVTYKDDEASLEKASRVAESLRGATNPMFMDTLGWVYYKRNQLDLALPLIKEAAQRAPDVAQINYHLALALHSKAQHDSAIEYLEKAVNSDQSFVGKSHAKDLLGELKSRSAADA